jgi:PTS system fructose-specific IIC component
MNLTQILEPTCVKVPLKGKNSEAVITELVDLLSARGVLSDRDMVLDDLLMRERTRGSSIGKGIAMPHDKSRGVRKLAMAIGITPEPIDFESPDRKPVKIIILLVAPPEHNVQLLQALSRIKRLMLDEMFKAKIETIKMPEELYQLVSENEKENQQMDFSNEHTA